MTRRKTVPYEENHKTFGGVLFKLCSKCGKWKPCTSEYFYSNKCNKSDGLFPSCKECDRRSALERKWNNIDDVREKQRIRFKTIYHNDPKIRERQSRNSRKTREGGYHINWRRKPENKEKQKFYNKNHQHKKHNISEKEWELCKQYFNNSCAYCGLTETEQKELFNEDLHKEHAINNGANDLSNCVPSCKICNSEKRTSDFYDWYNFDNIKFHPDMYFKILQWLNADYKKYKMQ